MPDEGFQEIHLGNKQLVFLAMTGIVVLVIAFLFGVLVGRGVRSQDATEALAEVTPAAEMTPTQAADPAPAAAPPSSAPLSTPEPVGDEDLGYQRRLEGEAPATESIAPAQPPAAKPAPTVKRAPEPAPPVAKATPANAPAASTLAEPSAQGFAVQVVALRDRVKAEAVARRLAGKGHRAYLVAPGGRGGGMYRVVIGKFKTRSEAEQVKRRIEKEEQFKPWIIR